MKALYQVSFESWNAKDKSWADNWANCTVVARDVDEAMLKGLKWVRKEFTSRTIRIEDVDKLYAIDVE